MSQLYLYRHYAFILTTTDETYLDAQLWHGGYENIDCSLRNHVMCIRTKSYDDLSDPATAFTGGKLAIYSKWMYSPPDYTVPIVEGRLSGGTDLIVQDYEYYDYENYNNRTETGNDYYNALNGIDAAGLPGSGRPHSRSYPTWRARSGTSGSRCREASSNPLAVSPPVS